MERGARDGLLRAARVEDHAAADLGDADDQGDVRDVERGHRARVVVQLQLGGIVRVGAERDGDLRDAAVRERRPGRDAERVEDAAVGVGDEGVALQQPAGFPALDAELRHVQGGVRAVLGEPGGAAARARGGGGQRAEAARARAEEPALQGAAELDAHRLRLAVGRRALALARARAHLHGAAQAAVVGVRLGGRADVARHRARHVRGAEANARGAAGLREDAQLEDDAAVVVAGAAVRADGLLDAVARERALGARQRRHRGEGAPEPMRQH